MIYSSQNFLRYNYCALLAFSCTNTLILVIADFTESDRNIIVPVTIYMLYV